MINVKISKELKLLPVYTSIVNKNRTRTLFTQQSLTTDGKTLADELKYFS